MHLNDFGDLLPDSPVDLMSSASGQAPLELLIAQNPELRQRMWRNFHERRNPVNTLGAEIPGILGEMTAATLGRDWQPQGASLIDRISLRKQLAPRDSGAGPVQTWMAGFALVSRASGVMHA
jgi:hypothetical protein